MKKEIIIMLNSFWNHGKGMSGGDQMLIQIFGRIEFFFKKVYCITNYDGQAAFDNKLQNASFLLSSQKLDKLNIILNYFFRTIQAFRILRLKNIDIIYGGSDFLPDVLPCFIYKKLHPNVKWIQCIFHIYPNYKVRPGNKTLNLLAQYSQRFSFYFSKKADTVVNINSQVKSELIKLGFKQNRIAINTPGIDFEFLNNITYDLSTPKFDATFLGRLNHSKGIIDLIKIWKLVVNEVPNAKLLIIGSGSRNIILELNKLINKYGLNQNITLSGYLNDTKAFKIIKKSRVFLFPSHEEGFGIAIAEALALEKLVISWDLEVYDEIFNDCITKIPMGNFNNFSSEIIKILSKKNIHLLKKINEDNSKFIRKYDWSNVASNHLKIITDKKIL
jgi:glycosyltransferase involved in cell wall biosynthesis